jgi:hypothetical protein
MADRVEGREHQVGIGADEMSELIRRKLRDAEAAAKRELPVSVTQRRFEITAGHGRVIDSKWYSTC